MVNSIIIRQGNLRKHALTKRLAMIVRLHKDVIGKNLVLRDIAKEDQEIKQQVRDQNLVNSLRQHSIVRIILKFVISMMTQKEISF